jgi:hypothetical protein
MPKRKISNENDEYKDEPLGDLRVVEDFLPKPEDIIFREEDLGKATCKTETTTN